MNFGDVSIRVYVRKLHGEGRYPQLPFKKHVSDAGWDLFTSREQVVPASKACNIHTDIAIAIPEGWYVHLLGRSSTIKQHGMVVNSGVIDQGYRGELFIMVVNMNAHDVKIHPGMRLAQMLMLPVPFVNWMETHTLPPSDRSHGGFGSTGV